MLGTFVHVIFVFRNYETSSSRFVESLGMCIDGRALVVRPTEKRFNAGYLDLFASSRYLSSSSLPAQRATSAVLWQNGGTC